MFYSKTTNGFYTQEIHGNNMPIDVVSITEEQHTELFNGQSADKQIVGDENGYPILIERPIVELTYQEKRRQEYPPMADYIDGIVKGDAVQVQTYIDACLAVKAKYPKE
jgi:hypothetical protein